MLKKTMLCAALSCAVLWGATSVAHAQEKPAGPAAAPQWTEDEAIAKLVPESTWEEKDIATRRLRQIGTPKSVPALAAMLSDDKVSHLARYALETMDNKQAADALIEAAKSAKGASKAGAIISLGARKEAGAVPVVAEALLDESVEVVVAAAGALGRIGTSKAADALLDAAKVTGNEALRPALGEGLIAAMESLLDAGKNADAMKIAETLQGEVWPEQARFGGYRGLIAASRGKADEHLVATLGGDDAKLRDYAAFLIATAPKLSDTTALAGALPKLPPAGQVALLNGFAGRKDAKARPAANAALDSPEATVRAAAARALGAFGVSEHVPRLAALLGSDAAVSDAAKNALSELNAEGVDEAIAAAAANAQPGPKALLLAVLANRMAPQTNAIAAQAIASDNAELRLAAADALAKLGGKDDVPTLLAALAKTGDSAERAAFANALNAVAGVQKDEVLGLIGGAFGGASVEVRTALFGALVRIGSANALKSFLAELGEDENPGRNEAVQLLTQWPTAEAAEPLLRFAKKDEARRAVLLRGYVRLATAEGDAAKKTQMLNDAWQIAGGKDEKWIVLPGWGSLATPQSLEFLTKLLDDKEIPNEAGSALITAAKEFAKQGEEPKKAAIEALKAVVAKADNRGIQDRAKKTLKDLGVDLDAAPAK